MTEAEERAFGQLTERLVADDPDFALRTSIAPLTTPRARPEVHRGRRRNFDPLVFVLCLVGIAALIGVTALVASGPSG